MIISENARYILAASGLLLLGLGYALYTYGDEIMTYLAPESIQKEVHVHAGFLFSVLGEKVDLTADRYQSSAQSVKHPSMHFHDGIDNMLHRHAEGITLKAFMESIGLTLTDSCVTLDTGASYCTDSENTLQLFVNEKSVLNIAEYVIQEEDRLLLYFGNPTSPEIPTLTQSVSDEACVYSGTCPERGDPPAESCGITCEI